MNSYHTITADDHEQVLLRFEGGMLWTGSMGHLRQALEAKKCLTNMVNAHRHIDPASTAKYMEDAKKILRDPA
jgi:hypothetical protein